MSDTYLPGRSEFSADEEKAMRDANQPVNLGRPEDYQSARQKFRGIRPPMGDANTPTS